jgi:hypothetical protein
MLQNQFLVFHHILYKLPKYDFQTMQFNKYLVF